jgi:NADPH2:quinone reductase
VLTIEPVDVPPPGPGEALIRHTEIGLNFVEVYFRRGTFQVAVFPAVLGNEGAGVVEAVGLGVSSASVGDRVVYADGPLGAYATARTCLVRIPDAVSDAQAAAGTHPASPSMPRVRSLGPLRPHNIRPGLAAPIAFLQKESFICRRQLVALFLRSANYCFPR